MNNNDDELRNNRANIVPHDSNMRGYSVANSFYDNPFNMDFEYGYLNLMFNMNTFVARSQDMFSNFESSLATIIETQNERRHIVLENNREDILSPSKQIPSHECLVKDTIKKV